MHDTRRITYFFSAFLLAASPLSAGETVNISRTSGIELALQNNRELAIAELAISRAKVEARWAGRLDNPELELNYSDDGVGLDENEGVFEVAFAQRFPITSRLKDEKRLRAQQILLSEAEIAERRRELAGEVDLAVIELLATRSLLEQQRELLALNAKIVSFLDEQAAQGVVSKLDATQAKLTGRSLKQRISAHEAQEVAQAAEVKKLIGLAPETHITLANGLRLPGSRPEIRTAYDAIFSQRPDLVLALAKIGEADAALAFETAKRWEDVSLRVFAERERAVDAPIGLERNSFLGVGISIPLPLRQRNQAGIEKAQIDRTGAEKSVEATRFHIRSEYEEAYQHRLANWNLAREASGEVLTLADENFEEYEKAYREGQASFLQVQRAQEQQLGLQTAATEAVAEYYRADAQLRFVTGDYPGLIRAGGANTK
ncbi:MAG: TolC family protein [Verrucomicrobiales bacterium]|nr:TolC family protein [Verrucomicrobiales bacterium]